MKRSHDKPIKIAIVGVGHWHRGLYLNSLKTWPDAIIEALRDRDVEQARVGASFSARS
jgi:hypothetical protein